MEFEFNDVLSALANVRTEIPVVRPSSRMHLGGHDSIFFGPSYNFFDIQEFDPERDPPNQIIPALVSEDDDIILARKCIEQHEVRILFLADFSSSLDTGVNLLKRRLLLETIGFMGAAASRQQDPVGILGFTDRVVVDIPPRCGLNNFYYLLRCAYDFFDSRDGGKARSTDFFNGLDSLRKAYDKPCFVPIISDFIGFERIINSPLFRFIKSRHELIFIFLDDPSEFSRNSGWGFLQVEDIETGKSSIVSRRKLRGSDLDLRQKRREMRKELRRMGIDSVVLEYGKHIKRLRRFFITRQKAIRS